MADENAMQLQLIADMNAVLEAKQLRWWLFGGWGVRDIVVLRARIAQHGETQP